MREERATGGASDGANGPPAPRAMREVLDVLQARPGELPGFGSRGTGLVATAGFVALPAMAGALARAIEGLGASSQVAGPLGLLAALLAPVVLLIAPATVARRPRIWRGALPLLAWGLGGLFALVRPEPLVVLVALAVPLLVTAGLLGWLSGPLRHVPPDDARQRARGVGALAGALLLWLLCLDAAPGAWAAHAGLLGGLCTASVILGGDRRTLLVSLAFSVLPALPVTSPGALSVPGLVWLVALTLRRQSQSGALGTLLAQPARVMVVTFVLAGVAGAALLALPESTESRVPLAFVDALFTAFSAVCVTGLGVVDTPTTFSAFGELVLVLLIQAGGLGIMTFSTAAVVLAGERLSMRHESAAASLLKAEDHSKIADLLRLTFKVTVVVEGVGILLLTGLFMLHGDGAATAAWRGLFTAISAFCNAGFALQSDNLIGYQLSPGVLGVVGLLIILGGTGPLVVAAVAARARSVRKGLDLHAKLVVVTTVALLLAGFLLMAAAEWNHTLKGMSFTDKVMNAFFLSVTPRTAGFNSIDYAAVTPATFTLTLVLMFVGGSPGSTAGGIKTTTLAVLVLLVRQAFRGDARVNAFGYSLKVEALREAVAVTVLSVVTVLGLLLSLNLTQAMPFDMALFESISAVGTVGLSVGGTARLDEVGKVLVTLGMLAGRVGPLTLLLVVANRRSRRLDWQPEARVDVG
jgi:trk system potassium uptake protein TrkH